MTRRLPLLFFLFAPTLWAEPVNGSVQIGSAQPVKVQDGWVGSDCTPRFLNVFLVPYKSPKRQLEDGKPYVQVCAWFDKDKPDLSKISMATLTVSGVPAGSESKYTFNDSRAARQMLQLFQVQGRNWHFVSSMKNVTSPYPKTVPGSWDLDVTVAAPKAP